MSLVDRLSIRIKLLLLAGVPVVGALILAAVILRDARQRANAAAALGSIEDLARLSVQMSEAVRALQSERAHVALGEGRGERPGGALAGLERQYAETDEAIGRLEEFLTGKDLSKLPPRLAGDLAAAHGRLARRGAFRERAAREAVPVDEVLAYYGGVDDALIGATAALAQLSDDGELLRSIWSLVALSELAERASREHALLGAVFAAGQFPPGTFKTLVTLGTEQEIYADAFRANASDERARGYDGARRSEAFVRAAALREKALTNTDDTLDVDAGEWFRLGGERLATLRILEHDITWQISATAARKVGATRASVRLGVGLSAAVVLAPAALAWVIARGVTRPVSALARAAARVREAQDFRVRVRKTSSDELGVLTDAFNEMLAGLEAREGELEMHRTNLEAAVAQRTAQLAARHEAMRLVLDNVEQGLATVRADGTFDFERSAAFDRLLGPPAEGAAFHEHVGGDERTRMLLKLGWEMAVEDALPLEVALGQLPTRMSRGELHYKLGYRPILRKGKFEGALLVVTDVTAEVKARLEQERQGEYVAVFERVAQDRDGFVAFVKETSALVDRLEAAGVGEQEVLAAVHTVKGNAAQWGASSVAKVAHEIESQAVDTGLAPDGEQTAALVGEWGAFLGRFRSLFAGAAERVELTREEVDEMVARLRARAPHEEIAARLERCKHEPATVRFQRMADALGGLADRLGKPRPRVTIEANDVRLPASRFAGFWASTVHVLRNMMDHGVEAPEARAAAGKPEAGRIALRAWATDEHFALEFGDDGGGVDWAAVGRKAREAGLPARDRADLERALFAPGLSTAARVTDVSGRGVGLSAVQSRCAALGGRVRVESAPGEGTRFVFTFPRGVNEHSLLPEALTSLQRAG